MKVTLAVIINVTPPDEVVDNMSASDEQYLREQIAEIFSENQSLLLSRAFTMRIPFSATKGEFKISLDPPIEKK